MAREIGIPADKIIDAIKDFEGAKRRFQLLADVDGVMLIDDYAHHPEELAALIKGAKHLFPDRTCVIAFQPHLFSRTRDFADGFARSLDMADELLLLDIYPARELPMEGVTTKMITDRMKNQAHRIVSKEELLEYVKNTPMDMFITSGAGDIDKLVEPIKKILESK